MSFLTKLFGGGNGYNDSKLLEITEKALEDDPMIRDHSLITTSIEAGVIKLGGIVRSTQEQNRVENAVRTSLTNSGLKFDHIENHVKVS